jgi:hypothetical protein
LAGSAGVTGPTGPTGLAGLNGVTGPTGSFTPNGTYYSDYIYWDNASSSWQVGSDTIHIGKNTGATSQGATAVAIGNNAGNLTQGSSAVAIGPAAGSISQNTNAVAIGSNAGNSSQGTTAVAIGYLAGSTSQGADAIAIGAEAGRARQGANAIAIGADAGRVDQSGNSIALNATGVALNPDASGFYVAPVRDSSSGICAALRYDVSRNEIVRSNFGIYGVGTVTLPAAGVSSEIVSFPGMTSDGIVMLSIKYTSDTDHSALVTLSYKCDTNLFKIYSDISPDFPVNVTWAVVKL